MKILVSRCLLGINCKYNGGSYSIGSYIAEKLGNPEWRDLKESIRLDENSVILCFSTEGDTDQENYRKIVWDGAYSS